VRNGLEAVDREAYALTDSSRAPGIRHKASRAVLKVVSSDAKKQMGIVNGPGLVVDEPGAGEEAGGLLMSVNPRVECGANTRTEGQPGQETVPGPPYFP